MALDALIRAIPVDLKLVARRTCDLVGGILSFFVCCLLYRSEGLIWMIAMLLAVILNTNFIGAGHILCLVYIIHSVLWRVNPSLFL